MKQYDVALAGLNSFLATKSHLIVEEPRSEAKLARLLRPVVLEKDTEYNFSTAVHERVLAVLDDLYPDKFRDQSGDGAKDITDMVCHWG
jgi:hypothetical protein